MGRHSTLISPSAALTSSPSPSKKRGRNDGLFSSELGVDVLAAEPSSKKALRKAKKRKHVNFQTPTTDAESPSIGNREASVTEEQSKPSVQSDLGVWIGNLPWTASKTDLRNFLSQNLESGEQCISRVHMPLTHRASGTLSHQRRKQQNKGFAYVDFRSREAHTQALTLTEKLISGRRVLIKDAKSFEGRPQPTKVEVASDPAQLSRHSNTKIFVGNLGFDITKEDLTVHFGQCGEVVESHVATFEDSGKCKGYAWVEFARLEDAEAAVRGWVALDNHKDVQAMGEEDTEAVEQSRKGRKPRKWWTNKLQGRILRMEFAEDTTARYKKRFGKNGIAQKLRYRPLDTFDDDQSLIPMIGDPASSQDDPQPLYTGPNRQGGVANGKPGAAPAAALRPLGAGVEGRGKKTMLD